MSVMFVSAWEKAKVSVPPLPRIVSPPSPIRDELVTVKRSADAALPVI